MPKSEQLKIKIKANDKQALSAFGRVTGRLNRLGVSQQNVKRGAVALTTAVVGLAGGMFYLTKQTATAYDKIQKFSDQLGISTQFISKMQVAGQFAGVEITAMHKAIQKMSVAIGEANRGLATYGDAFKDLGVNLKRSDGALKSSEDIMLEMADAFSNLSDSTLKANVAYKIFGARGMSMLQAFKGGSAGLKEMWQEAEKFGLVVSKVAGQNSAEFNDSLTRMSFAFQGVRNAIAESVMPTLTKFFNGFATYLASNREAIASWGLAVIKSMGAVAESVIITTSYFVSLGQRASRAFDATVFESYTRDLNAMEEQFKMLQRRGQEPTQAMANAYQELHLKASKLREELSKPMPDALADAQLQIAKLKKTIQDVAESDLPKLSGGFGAMGSEVTKVIDRITKEIGRMTLSPLQLLQQERDAMITSVGDNADAQAKIWKWYTLKRHKMIESITAKLKSEAGKQKKIEDSSAKSFAEGWKSGVDEFVKTLQWGFDKGKQLAQEFGNTMTGAIEKALGGNFKGAMDDMLTYFKKVLTQMIMTALANPINMVMNFIGGAMPAGAGLAGIGGGSGVGGLGGLGKGVLGGTGFMGMLGSGLAGYAIGDMFGGYGKYGGAVGGIAGGALGGSTLAITAVTSAVGGVMPAVIGTMVMPVIGTIIGALLGGVLGGLFGKKKEKIPYSRIGFGQGEMTGADILASDGFSLATKNFGLPHEESAKIQAYFGSLRDSMTGFLEAIGGDMSRINEAWISKKIKIKKGEDLEGAIKQWTQDYVKFVTGINFTDFQRSGEELTNTIDRMVKSIMVIGEFAKSGGQARPMADVDFGGFNVQKIYDEIDLEPKTVKDNLDTLTQNIKNAVGELSGLSGVEWGNKISEIGGMLEARYETELQYLGAIKSLALSISTSIQGQIEGFELSLMTHKEKITYYNDTLADLFDQLGEATDPTKIADIVTQIQQISSAGWSEMSEAEKKSSLDSVKAFLKSVDELAGVKLKEALEAEKSAVDQLASDLQGIDWSPLGELTASAGEASSALKDFANSVGATGGSIPTGQQGIKYTKEGLHYLHDAERVLSAPERIAYESGRTGGSDQPVIIMHLDGDASAVIKSARIEGADLAIERIRKDKRIIQ